MEDNKVRAVSGKQAIYHRNYRRARDRALTRLAQEYPDKYRQYLQEEKTSDEVTGKKWLAVDNSSAITIGSSIGWKDINENRTDTSDKGTNEGYYGGEE